MVWRKTSQVSGVKNGAPPELVGFPHGEQSPVLRPPQKGIFPLVGNVCVRGDHQIVRIRAPNAMFPRKCFEFSLTFILLRNQLPSRGESIRR